MTTVYGVTFVGARAQIEKQLRDLEAFPEEKVWGAASYLAKLVRFFQLDQSSKSCQLTHISIHIGYGHYRGYFQRG